MDTVDGTEVAQVSSSSVERLVGAQECDSRSLDIELENLYAKVRYLPRDGAFSSEIRILEC